MHTASQRVVPTPTAVDLGKSRKQVQKGNRLGDLVTRNEWKVLILVTEQRSQRVQAEGDESWKEQRYFDYTLPLQH